MKRVVHPLKRSRFNGVVLSSICSLLLISCNVLSKEPSGAKDKDGSSERGGDIGAEPRVANADRHRIACGYYFSCAIVGAGRVKCWGENLVGQLGNGTGQRRGEYGEGMGDDLPFVMLASGDEAVSIAAGSGHACVLLKNGAVKCWGYNYHGELGLGDHEHRGTSPFDLGDYLPAVDLGEGRTALAITAGESTTCAVLDNGSVKCWGSNEQGRLGVGRPVEAIGKNPDEMGEALPVVDLGGEAIDISAGWNHTCARMIDGKAKCWGGNEFGQLGLGDTVDRGAQQESMGSHLSSVDLGEQWRMRSIVAGNLVTCSVSDDGTLKCFGDNRNGDLGLGDTQPHGLLPSELGDSLPAVDLGTDEKVVSVASRLISTCALLESGRVKCFGAGVGLAQGDTQRRGDTQDDMGDALTPIDFGVSNKVIEIAVGSRHACALFDDDSIRCWGEGPGIGILPAGKTQEIQGDEPVELGTNWPAVDLGSSDGPNTSPSLSDCQYTRGGCRRVCQDLYKSCSNRCPELNGSMGAVWGYLTSCENLSAPVDTITECKVTVANTAQYIRCCCE